VGIAASCPAEAAAWHVADLEPVSLNLRTMSGQFGGSRSNLRRLLDRAYELGLLQQPPKGGAEILLSTRMLCSFLGFLASFLSNFQLHAQTGLARLMAQSPERRP